MTSELVDRRAHNEAAPEDGHRFFDYPAPEQPEELFGIDTQAVLDLGRAATALGALPPRVNLGLYALPDAVRLVPLVEEMQAGSAMQPEDIRPYRKSIKRLSPGVNFADRLATGASAVGVGIPLRRALNNKIEREFPERAQEAMGRAREVIASIEQDVDYISAFENPKKQFTHEVDSLADAVTDRIVRQRDLRVSSAKDDRTYRSGPDTIAPRGIMGLFTKAVRKVRDFFGIFHRDRQPVNPAITAYDAGAGIAQALRSLLSEKEAAAKRFPLLSRTVLSHVPDNLDLTRDRLALAAPEILNFLFSVTPDKGDRKTIMDSVRRNPHELRFVTRFKKRYGRYYLDEVQRASVTLLPAIRNVLPSGGSQVRRTYDQVRDLLQANGRQDVLEPYADSDEAKARVEKPMKLRDRLKSMFRKNKSIKNTRIKDRS